MAGCADPSPSCSRPSCAPRSPCWRRPLHAVAAQEPDAPADDGTGRSADEEPEENPEPGAAEQDIIPLPNSGREPTEAGDRGGALQILVFVVIVAGVGTIALLATRDVRRSRGRNRPSEPAEPAP